MLYVLIASSLLGFINTRVTNIYLRIIIPALSVYKRLNAHMRTIITNWNYIHLENKIASGSEVLFAIKFEIFYFPVS